MDNFTTIKEYLEDETGSPSEKYKALIRWVLLNTKGQCVKSTTHYEDGDIEEFSVPCYEFDRIEKELMEYI